MTQQRLIGNSPNQVALNKHIGSVAFQNIESATLGALQNQLTDTTSIPPSLMLDFANGRQNYNSLFQTYGIGFSRASTASYVDRNGIIQYARFQQPRIDHDPTTLTCRGLLTEPSSTNIVTTFNASPPGGYYAASGTVTSVVTPDGTANALFVKPNNGNGTGAFTSIWYPSSVSNSTTYTISAFVKPSHYPFIIQLYDNTTGAASSATLNADGTITSSTVTGYQIYPNGWVRLWFTYTTNSTSAYYQIYGYPPIAADGSTVGYYIWGVQMEQQPYVTSVIPTSGSAVTRAQDVFTLTQLNSPWGTGALGDYTLCHNYLCTTAIGSASRISSGPNYTFQNIIGVAQSTVNDITAGVGSFFGSGSSIYNINIRSQVRTAFRSYDSGFNQTLAANGQVGSDVSTYGTVYGQYRSDPTNLSTFYFGYGGGGQTNPGPVWHHKISYYPAALTRDEMVEITR